MATTQFAFCVMSPEIEAPYRTAAVVESKSVSGTNAATTAAATNAHNVCRVATDTAVYVSFAATPNAGTDTVRFLCPANSVSFFRIKAGDKAAAITV